MLDSTFSYFNQEYISRLNYNLLPLPLIAGTAYKCRSFGGIEIPQPFDDRKMGQTRLVSSVMDSYFKANFVILTN